jgi:hypothetical protein
MEMILGALLNGLAVFIALRLNKTIEAKIERGEPILPPFRALLQEKAEFLPPMTDEEYDAYEQKESEHGQLFKKIIAKAPWTSDRLKYPSLDSSSKTE